MPTRIRVFSTTFRNKMAKLQATSHIQIYFGQYARQICCLVVKYHLSLRPLDTYTEAYKVVTVHACAWFYS